MTLLASQSIRKRDPYPIDAFHQLYKFTFVTPSSYKSASQASPGT